MGKAQQGLFLLHHYLSLDTSLESLQLARPFVIQVTLHVQMFFFEETPFALSRQHDLRIHHPNITARSLSKKGQAKEGEVENVTA